MTRHLRGCDCGACAFARYEQQFSIFIGAMQAEPPAAVVRARIGNVTPLDPITRAHWKQAS